MIYFKLQYHPIFLLVISCVLVLSYASHAYGQTAPGQPLFLSATAASSSQVNLSWTAPTSGGAVTGYKIEVRTTTASDYPATPLVANTGSAGTSYMQILEALEHHTRIMEFNRGHTFIEFLR